MDPALAVVLKVKAPNNKIEDQIVQCESTWTIHKLKVHLSEVYPSRPTKEEQKLIYLGQLLSDSIVLRDILRQYDGQEMHTVHLVCSTHRDIASSQKVENVAHSTQQPPPPPPVQQHIGAAVTGETEWPSYYDPNQYAIHMAYMHQAYVHYMTQYMNMAGTNVEPVVEVPEAPEVVEEQPREADAVERDWLDWFYVLSRLMVLFSIVYFYSSPVRFVAVLFCGVILYLYQVGFFRNQIINNNNDNNNVPPGGDRTATVTQAPERQQPQPFALCLRFFVTFFASLIPEIPNAV